VAIEILRNVESEYLKKRNFADSFQNRVHTFLVEITETRDG